MLIENKWVVCDSKDDVYYIGDNDRGDPVFESLNSRVRTYKNEKGAKASKRRIENSGNELVEFCVLKVVHIERGEVPDVPADIITDKLGQASSEPPKEPPIIQNHGDWITIDSFGRIKYVKKLLSGVPFFAVLDANGDLRGFGFDELAAWTWYSDHRRDVGIGRIKSKPPRSVGKGR